MTANSCWSIFSKTVVSFHKFASIALAGSLAFAGQNASAQSAVQPNIILIVADDLGYGDIEPYGQTRIRTPALSRLAASGTLFTNFYAGSPTCAPSRCTLMTGRNSGSCPIRTNYKGQLPGAELILPERLQSAGYVTGIFGKWALGSANTPTSSQAQGFDYSFGYQDQLEAHQSYPQSLWASGGHLFTQQFPASGAELGAVQLGGAVYAPDLILEQSLAFMREEHSKPYFLYFATTVPHANNENENQGKLEVSDLGIYENLNWTLPNRQYASLVTRLDNHVGQLWAAALADTSRPTILIFTADNGPHGIAGVDINFFKSTGGLRDRKASLYEGGIRVPMIVWSNEAEPSVEDRPGYFPDLNATILAQAGLAIPAEVSGIDLLNREPGNGDDHSLYFEYHTSGGGQWAVRTGRWKSVSNELSGIGSRILGYVLRLGMGRADWDPGVELYDLVADPDETTDVAAQHPQIVARHEAIAADQHVRPGLSEEFEMFRRRESIDKFTLISFGGAATLLAVALASLEWRRRRRNRNLAAA